MSDTLVAPTLQPAAPSRLSQGNGPQVSIAIDLFAGAGGLSLGFEQAGFRVVAAIDVDPIHCGTHEFNFPDCITICRDVATLSGAEIRKRSGIRELDIDVVFGGPPCQGFSLIGKRALDDPRNGLVHHYVRLVAELRPKFFVFENVKGLMIGNHRQFLDELLAEFKKRGYVVREPYRVLNAANFGVPQNRERLFLIGAREDLPLPEYPAPTHNSRLNNGHLDGLPFTPTVWEAFGDLPKPEDYDELLTKDWVYAGFSEPSAYAQTLRQGNETCADLLLLSSSLRTIHTKDSIKRFEKTHQGEVELVSRFYKLDPEGLCNTLRAGTASDRGAFTSPRPIHPFTPRCITVREAARVHSYPDWFRFHVTKWHGFRQIGNSVPPLLARAVATQIASVVGIKPTECADRRPRRNLALLGYDMRQAAMHYRVPPDVIAPRRRLDNETYAEKTRRAPL